MNEQLTAAEGNFGCPSVTLGELAEEVTLGRVGLDLSDKENAIFVPMIGTSNVVERIDEFTLKAQNYARVVIKPDCCNARFVANYLNSELGKATREASKT